MCALWEWECTWSRSRLERREEQAAMATAEILRAHHLRARPHLALDLEGGVHQVAQHADGLVVHALVLRAQHLDEDRQRPALHDLRPQEGTRAQACV